MKRDDLAPPAPLASARHTLRFLVICIGIAAASYLQAGQSHPGRGANRLPLYFSLAAVELLFVWYVRLGVRARGATLWDVIGKSWSSARDAGRDLLIALVFGVAVTFCTTVAAQLLGRWATNVSWVLPQTFAERTAWVVVAITAGGCEELVYRGYLQRQLWSWSRSLLVAVLLQAVIFGSAHIYQGWKSAVVTALYGLLFGLLAAWRRSVLPGAIAHAAIDIFGGFRFG